MDISLLLALIAATTLLVAIPGPNVALIVANTIAYGFRFGAITVFGTTIGILVQLVIIVLGLAAVLEYTASAFSVLKWLGVAYLLYLGVAAWRSKDSSLNLELPSEKPLSFLFWQGLLLATINPKTLIFNAAFLPQFISSEGGSKALVATAFVYLLVILVGDLVWAAAAKSARPYILKFGQWRHKLTGVLFVGSGIGLALARESR